jgi:hypothetical protein
MSLNFDPQIIFNSDFDTYGYNRSSNFVFMYLGEIGVAYRF